MRESMEIFHFCIVLSTNNPFLCVTETACNTTLIELYS